MEEWVLVTGASGGIGAATALRLAQNGYHLHLQYHQNKEAVERIAARCRDMGVQVLLHQADLTVKASVLNLAEAVKLPHPVGLVYAAGKDQYGMLQDLSMEEWDELLMLHLTAPFMLIQSLLPWMIQQQFGRIIYLSSIWGTEGAAYEAAYSAVKSGMNGLVRALGKEVTSSGVTVNAVAPGAIETKMMQRFSHEELTTISEEIPARRLGKANEVASLICYLMQKESAYITGQVLHINGGWLTP
ncbi:elongation factor P 5-aminopentanone reductase [Rubeoparvulum massiliense]|uniref:elongation factor P 5-aminopentanone reductase n=1 Tax=Rubeoparvulum massiliense TaxID=1631346 RepID=UPI00065DD073|nr:SDR family oxidoreductase [Rubeoparvulum massiliense]